MILSKKLTLNIKSHVFFLKIALLIKLFLKLNVSLFILLPYMRKFYVRRNLFIILTVLFIKCLIIYELLEVISHVLLILNECISLL